MFIFQVLLNLMIFTSSWALPQFLWSLLWSALPTWAGIIAIDWANTSPALAAKIWKSATSTTSTEHTPEDGVGRENMVTVIKFMFPTPTLRINLMTTETPELEIKTQYMLAINHLDLDSAFKIHRCDRNNPRKTRIWSKTLNVFCNTFVLLWISSIFIDN